MASVFLSYAREDAAKAKALARLLEKAGFTVWWDRHIQSGAEYIGAIEQALSDADAILVLWSRSAVSSAWVRDEAEEGRDSGRLVPAILDGSRPPIGFRQFQTFELSGWSGKGPPRQLDELVGALNSKTGGVTPERTDTGRRSSPHFGHRISKRTALLGMLALALIAAGAWLHLSRNSTRVATPTVAVLPFADLSPQRDKAFLIDGITEEILSLLGREPGLRVIGRSSSQRFQGVTDYRAMQKSLGVTHVVEGSARTAGDEIRLSVRLIDAATGSQVWAQDYHRELTSIFALQDEIGRAVATRLKGTLASHSARKKGEVTSPANYARYLEARATMRERKEGPLREALGIAREVMNADPNYAPARALYAEILSLLSYDDYGKLPPQRVFELARPHALAAIRIAPEASEGYAALGLISIRRPNGAIEPLRRAIRLDPARAELHIWLADSYSHLGRNTEALEHYRVLVEMEPLWQPSIALYAVSLGAAEQFEQAHALVDAFERRGGRRSEAVILRGRFAEMRGDLSKAVEHATLARQLDPQMNYTGLLLGWYYHMLGLGDRSQEFGESEPLYTRLLWAGREDALIAEVRKAGINALEQPDSDVAVAALGRARDWPGLVRIYDIWKRSAHEGCVDTSGGGVTAARRRAAMVPLQFTAALRALGRTKDAAALLGCVKRNIDRQSGDPIRHYSLSAATTAFIEAQMLAMQGQNGPALEALRRAVDKGWRGWHSTRIDSYPALDGLRSHDEFNQIQRRLDQLIAADRSEVLGHRILMAA